jgi:hypothetical protein
MKRLILLTAMTFIGLYLVITPSINKEYWESVGPSINKSLNPDKYSNEE